MRRLGMFGMLGGFKGKGLVLWGLWRVGLSFPGLGLGLIQSFFCFAIYPLVLFHFCMLCSVGFRRKVEGQLVR